MVKSLAKKIIQVWYRLVTPMELRFRHHILDIRYDKAKDILTDYSRCPDGVVYSENKMHPIFDLQIVIPAYNVEKYIKQCLDSVISQKTKYTFTAVVVDDGSTDKTSEIIDAYSNNEHIKIIHQENKGFSRARNAGLSELIGNYVMFIDSDDYLCEGAIDKLLDMAYAFKADIVEGSAFTFDDQGRIERNYEHQTSINHLDYASNLRGMPWGKVIKANLFEYLKFPEGYWYEDSIFAYCIYPFTEKKYTLSEYVYAYRKNPDGISIKGKMSKKAVDTYWILDYLWRWSLKSNSAIDLLQRRILDNFALSYIRTNKLCDDITKAGFCFLRQAYLECYRGTYPLGYWYKKLDLCIRKEDYGQFKLLCSRWSYLAK